MPAARQVFGVHRDRDAGAVAVEFGWELQAWRGRAEFSKQEAAPDIAHMHVETLRRTQRYQSEIEMQGLHVELRRLDHAGELRQRLQALSLGVGKLVTNLSTALGEVHPSDLRQPRHQVATVEVFLGLVRILVH